MATVTGFTADHLTKWLTAQDRVTEEIVFGGSIDDTQDLIHTLNLPDTIEVPYYLTVCAMITLESSATASVSLEAQVDAVEVASVANTFHATSIPVGFIIPTSTPILIDAETAAVVTLHGERLSGSGTSSQDATFTSLVTAIIQPDWSQFSPL